MDITPQLLMWSTSIILVALLLISLQQLFISPIEPNTTPLRIGLSLSLMFEILVLILELISIYYMENNTTLKFMVHLLFWILICIFTFCIYKTVRPPRLYENKWSSMINKFWLFISSIHIIFILICFILFLVFDSIFYEEIYYIEFNIYIICGSIILIIISSRVKLTINESIYKLNKSQHSQFNDYIYDDDKNEIKWDIDRMRSDNMNTFANDDDDDNKKIDSDFVDPMVTLAMLSKAKYALNVNIFLCIFMIALSFPTIYFIVYHSIDDISFIAIIPYIFHYLFVSSFYIVSIINNWYSSKNKQLTYSIYNELIQCFVLKKQRSNIGKNKKSQTSNSKQSKLYKNANIDKNILIQQSTDNTNTANNIQNNDGNPNSKTEEIEMERKEEEKLTETVPNLTDRSTLISYSVLQTINDENITSIVFELDHVLCTNIDNIHNKMEGHILSMTSRQKQLCFGGQDRIKLIKDFLKYICHQQTDDDDGISNIKCFIVSDEWSKMIVELLKDTKLLKYFISKQQQQHQSTDGDNNNDDKFISHIIGWDHNISKESHCKKHLILLKLLQSLQCKHDEMLYIGNNKEVIQHLNTIKLCKTYLCETNGLTQKAINQIQETYF